MKKVVAMMIVAAGFCLNSGVSSATPVTFADNGHEYDIVLKRGIPWQDALIAASLLGGDWDLATITSQEEQAFIEAHVLSQVPGTEFWLGGFQAPLDTQAAASNWTWVTGEAWSYTNWNNGEPNDYAGAGSEQFLGIWGDGGWGLWNDEGGLANISGYIVERSPAPVPEPATLMLLGSGLLGLAGLRKRIG